MKYRRFSNKIDKWLLKIIDEQVVKNLDKESFGNRDVTNVEWVNRWKIEWKFNEK
jgi:hypothetical protein